MFVHSGTRIDLRVMRVSQIVVVLWAVLFAARSATAFVIVDLGTLGGTFSIAQAVNPSGQIVGFSFTGDGEIHAFSWTKANGMINLGTLNGYTHSFATASTLGVKSPGTA